jgi:hypothetical protein
MTMNDRAIGVIRGAAPGNIRFPWLRTALARDHGVKDALDFGHAVVDTTDKLDQYLYTYGPMIQSQWENIAPWLAQIDPPASLLDYGCGQGLAGLLASDLTGRRLFAEVRDIVLIEPSAHALARAVALYARLAPAATVTAIGKRFADVAATDMPATAAGATLHLFSNTLDLPGFDAPTLLSKTLRPGHHTILSVSHDRSFNGGTPQLTATKAAVDGALTVSRSTLKTFTCDNPGRSEAIAWLCAFEVEDG